jgi:hypothetical protein
MPANPSKSPERKDKNREMDAIALLTADHRAVKALFKQFEELTKQDDADEEKARVVEQICDALTIHAQVEEEIFYPAVREAIDDDDLMDEADVEHASVKDLVAQLEELAPGDDHYDARVTVLGEYVDHHVKEEEGEMFAKARKADVNTIELGEQIADRKDELKAELGAEDDEAIVAPAKSAPKEREERRR